MSTHPYLQRHHQRTRLLWLLVAVCVAGAALLVWTAEPAGAHHPQLSSTVRRPCGAQAPWSGTVTVSSDADYGKNWQNKHRIAGAAFTAFGPLVDDQVDYVFAVPNIPAGTASVVVDTKSRWQNKADAGGVVGPIPGSITLLRPAATDCPPPPTTTTTVSPVTPVPPPVLVPPMVIERSEAAVPVVAATLPYTG